MVDESNTAVISTTESISVKVVSIKATFIKIYTYST